ncbi:uncharacterized protein LOC130636101 isoform X3 [Hydractinia symbiolongicarpus]|nr:uncharacterized protein LOC130636101 isoform X3 [Hydractinia symbiolongicarpus]
MKLRRKDTMVAKENSIDIEVNVEQNLLSMLYNDAKIAFFIWKRLKRGYVSARDAWNYARAQKRRYVPEKDCVPDEESSDEEDLDWYNAGNTFDENDLFCADDTDSDLSVHKMSTEPDDSYDDDDDDIVVNDDKFQEGDVIMGKKYGRRYYLFLTACCKDMVLGSKQVLRQFRGMNYFKETNELGVNKAKFLVLHLQNKFRKTWKTKKGDWSKWFSAADLLVASDTSLHNA